jgi:hypothetical protein
MNCQTVQNKILALPDPRHIPAALLAHVAECPGCRVWAEQVARLESLLERLPTPTAPSDKKSALIDRLTTGRPLAVPARAPFVTFLQRNATLVGALAASLLVAIGGWWVFSNKEGQTAEVPGTPKNPFLDKVVQRDVALAKADTSAKKLQILGELADDLSGEARALSRIASPEELQDVAKWFDRVVKSGIIKQAEKIGPQAMSPAELKAEFGRLTNKLGTAATEAEKVLGEVPPESKPALQRIVDTARDGQKNLAKIAREKGA